MADEHTAFPLLRTKLHRPPVPEDLVPRAQLLAWLAKCRQRPLTLVSAAAGYGKSVLISSWLEACEWPGAWVSLDDADNDVRLFLMYVLAAVQTWFPAAGQPTQDLLHAVDQVPLPLLIRSIINDLNRIEQPFILVLDDYQRIHDPAVHDLLTILLDHPPRSMHLVLITRHDPPLPLARYRGRGQMTEIDTQALRFSTAETAAFLQTVLEVAVDDSTAAVIQDRTDGWVAGLRLAALSVYQRGEVDHLLHHLPEDNGAVMDYLSREVLAHLPPATLDALLTTSILDRFCASLCDTLCGPSSQDGSYGGGGEALFAWLKEANLFVFTLDSQQRWCRYHHLFQQVLQHRLHQHYSSDHIATLHARAGAWFAANGLIEEALQHTLAAGDIPAAMHLVAHHGHDLMNAQQWGCLASWLRRLPSDHVAQEPALLVLEAWMHQMHHDVSALEACLERVETLMSLSPPGTAVGAPYIQGHADALHGFQRYLVGDGERALYYTQRACEHIPHHHTRTLAFAHGVRAVAYQMVGELETGLSSLHQELSHHILHDHPYRAQYLVYLCLLYWMAADLTAIQQTAECLRRIDPHPQGVATVAEGHYYQGIVHYHRNELPLAEDKLTAVLHDFSGHYGFPFTHSAFALALTYQAQGRHEEAVTVGESVVSYALETNNVTLRQVARAFQADLALRQGRLAEASHWAQGFVATPFSVMDRFYVPQLTLVKVLLAQDTPDSRAQAAGLLTQLHDFITWTHNTRFRIDILALQALLHDARDDAPAAFTSLTEALTLAEPGGFIRVFVDLGPGMAHLLQRLSPQQVAMGYMDQLLAAFQADATGVTPAACCHPRHSPPSACPEAVVEPLTKRERVILDLLAQQMYQREIAAHLCISPETVKTHVKHLYQKLDARTRRQAIATATAWGLLSQIPPDLVVTS